MAPAVRASISGSTALKSAHVWEVSCPLPINPLGKGQHHFLPAQLTPVTRRRRVSVEVHKVKSLFQSVASDDLDPLDEPEICYVRILQRQLFNPKEHVLDPIEQKLKGGTKKAKLGTVNFFTGSRRKGDDADDDSASETSFIKSFREPSIATDESEDKTQAFDGWQPKYKIPLRMFRIVEKRKKNAVVVAFEHKGHQSTREFVFDSEDDLEGFCAIVEENKQLNDRRLQVHMKNALGGIELKKDEELTLLFDICSGTDLPQADIGMDSDPYVTVRFNGIKIHKTAYIPNEDHPIWTLRTGSLFIWKVNALELFQSEDGLVFEVKDYDAIGTNESLGAFNINARTLYKWDGERREFALKPLLGERDFGKGKISLRVRRATAHDVEFMEKFNAKAKGNALNLPAISAGSTLKSIMTVHSKKEKEGPDKGKTKYLVRPGPDPKRKEETAWLTKERIEEESMRPSYQWTDIGSGTLGKIFVEIIGCDDLPNLDTAGVLGDKTDSFVSLVYEDCFARTDVVDDCLSPRWMPWSNRAFIFNMMHTSSQLFIGVFDCDTNSMCNHDLVGRISVDVSSFRRNTTYLLKYNLFPTAKGGPRDAKFGTITIRLRMELEGLRTLLLSNFQMAESVYVNVDGKKDFDVIQKTVEGGWDIRKYSLKTINALNEELMSYLTIYYALEDAFISLLLWRGHSTLNIPVPSVAARSIRWVKVDGVPLHSMVAFVSIVSLVENPNLLPSFCLGCIGWILLATGERRANNPNPWMRSKSFIHFLSALVLGKSVYPPRDIVANEDVNSTQQTFWEKRVKDAEEKAKRRAEEYAEEQEQYLKEMQEIGGTNVDLATQDAGGVLAALDPARAYLFPIQQYLRIICICLRVTKNIILWEECYVSFWVAMSSFTIAVLAFFVPWGFIIKWILRIVVWLAFGPWMKLADIFYFRRLNEETDEQKKERMSHLRLERQKWLDKQKLEAQIAKEKASKLRDFKQYMFGELICRVNILKKDRYYDLPLPASSATMYSPKSKSLGELAMQEAGYRRTRVDGQQLVGEMIPKIYETPTTEAPRGKPAKRTDQLVKGSAAVFYDVDDSYSAAAIKVASIVIGAGAITWYGVPLFVYLFRLVLPE